MPFPVSVEFAALASLLVKVTVAYLVPTAEGENLTLMVHEPGPGSVLPEQLSPTTTKSPALAPDFVSGLIVA